MEKKGTSGVLRGWAVQNDFREEREEGERSAVSGTE
jgi:hypothetical protein